MTLKKEPGEYYTPFELKRNSLSNFFNILYNENWGEGM
jgi:hypothetical protein